MHCIYTAEDIVKFLYRPGSPISLVFDPLRRYPSPRTTPSVGAKYTGVGFFLMIFDRNRRLSRKRYEIGPWLLWNVNSKSSAVDRSVSVPMTFSDL